MRATGELLGLWAPADHTFYHPPFQFLQDGRVHPRLTALLSALAEIPTYAPADDPSGWGRIGWLLQPRWSLSERGVAESRSPTGIAPDEDLLAVAARAPVEVFPSDPESVIATALDDAKEIHEGR